MRRNIGNSGGNMAKLLFLLSIFVILPVANAQVAIFDRNMYEVLAPSVAWKCADEKSASNGYILKRYGHSELINIQTVVDGKQLDEKSDIQARVFSEGLFRIVLQHKKMSGEFGYYVEFMLAKKRDPRTLKFNGAVAFTESSIEENEKGEKRERFGRGNLHKLECEPLTKANSKFVAKPVKPKLAPNAVDENEKSPFIQVEPSAAQEAQDRLD
jgi:hypothetical protein